MRQGTGSGQASARQFWRCVASSHCLLPLLFVPGAPLSFHIHFTCSFFPYFPSYLSWFYFFQLLFPVSVLSFALRIACRPTSKDPQIYKGSFPFILADLIQGLIWKFSAGRGSLNHGLHVFTVQDQENPSPAMRCSRRKWPGTELIVVGIASDWEKGFKAEQALGEEEEEEDKGFQKVGWQMVRKNYSGSQTWVGLVLLSA